MDEEASNMGGSLVLRGVLGVLFGIAAVFWPGLTLLTLLYLFSAYILVLGIVDLVFGIVRLISDSAKSLTTRILSLLLGVLEIGVGVYLLRHPGVSFATFILLIGFSLIIRGVFEIVEGLFEKGTSAAYRTLMVVVGIFALLAGIIVLFQPVAGGVAFVWILGIYALVSGPLLIAVAVEANNRNKLTPVR